MKVGNAVAEIAATLLQAQHAAGNHFQLEQPARSLMIDYAPMKDALLSTGAIGYQRDACADGAPWRKPLVLYTATGKVGRSLVAHCPGCASHIRLRGKAPNGIDWTKMACPYWPAWARAVATRWTRVLRAHQRKDGWETSAPLMMAMEGRSHSETLSGSNFKPSGGRSIEKAVDTLATGLQPTRKALPQLIPDGLPPHVHLQAALATQHPLAYRPRATDPVQYALKYAPDDAAATRERRQAVAKTLRELAAACEPENNELLSMVEPSVAAVLNAFGVKTLHL